MAVVEVVVVLVDVFGWTKLVVDVTFEKGWLSGVGNIGGRGCDQAGNEDIGGGVKFENGNGVYR